MALARTRIDMVRTARLDRLMCRSYACSPTDRSVRLAVLGPSTVDHLLPGIRIGGLRRDLWIETHLGAYGQYLQDLLDQDSALYRFRPDTILFAFDAPHLLGGATPALQAGEADALLDQAAARLTGLWHLARERLGCHVIQQTILPTLPALAGGNEHRLAGSPAHLTARLNARLRPMADAAGVDLLAIDTAAAQSGIAAWHDPMLWHRAKQDISPAAAPLYGDLVARLLAARLGRSFKCLVLDLDNTLWGGVIGDDGMEGIQLGQGSALGEAHVAFQRHCRDLARRGVILAVCSKNDEAIARQPFEQHPEMVLRSSDIACFVANWNDKPANLRGIAERLRLGLESLVFVDDNPFERTVVRRELPMVAVPELPEDAALYAACIADAGYFETVRVTQEDLERSGQYQANLAREQAQASFTDMAAYLASLEMVLSWSAFDALGLARIVQLIHKTNQFNLTTRRHTEEEVRGLMADPAVFALQLRLVDTLGDNGIIAVVIGRVQADATCLIDTWLMSCRVLGREVERATMNIVAAVAGARGARRILGEYCPTARNGMVRDHYEKLGFRLTAAEADGTARWELDLGKYAPFPTSITIRQA